MTAQVPDRLEQIEQRLESLTGQVPQRLEQIEAWLVIQQAGTADAFEKLQAWTQALDKLGDQLTHRLDTVSTEVQEELAQLKSRIEESERATLMALAKLAPAALIANLVGGVADLTESVELEIADLKRRVDGQLAPAPTPSSKSADRAS